VLHALPSCASHFRFLSSLYLAVCVGNEEVEYRRTKFRFHPQPNVYRHPHGAEPLRWEGYMHRAEIDTPFRRAKVKHEAPLGKV